MTELDCASAEQLPRKKITTNSGRQMVQLLGGDIVYGRKLPFSLYDENGFLLAPQASKLPSREKQAQLIEREVFVDAKEHAAHMAKMASAVDFMFEKNVCLLNWREHAAFNDVDVEVLDDVNLKILATDNPFDAWDTIRTMTKSLLSQNMTSAGTWLQRLDSVVLLVQNALKRYPDASLYYLVQNNAKLSEEGSVAHALLCTAFCEKVAKELGMEDLARQRLIIAALTMNLAVTRLHNEVLSQKYPESEKQQKLLHTHGLNSAKLLHSYGITDPTLLCLVKNHQELPAVATTPTQAWSELDISQLILVSVDKVCSRMSPRGYRSGEPTGTILKEVVQELGKVHPQIAVGLLKAIGAYPQGSFVRLQNGEVGVVLTQGEKPSTPVVGPVFNKDGVPFTEVYRRDTARPQYAINESLSPQSVKAFIKTDNLLSIYVKK